ncbi:MAG: GAF domain-containing protein [Sediminibacterium sp.]|uniref:GAF domain-containing protein n=1 Tax=Sediminibacterium sp. TaxID=1917865 RepID=UPI002719DD3D|nr:GAF domain-containing protein [Sediminibacterium sp.]MDO8997013.1 GAF domain-containing protein [Sediminibacterium sp.]
MNNQMHSLEKSLSKRNAELSLLSSIQNALISQKEMVFIFNLVGDQLAEMFTGFVISIATFDQETGTEYFQYHFEEGIKSIPEPRPYNQIRQLLIDTHQQVIVNEKAENFVNELIGANYFIEADIIIPKSFFFVPLMVDDIVRGYISLKHYQHETVFDEESIRLLNTIAISISVSLQNERLIHIEKRKAAEQKALLDTMTDLSSKLELNQLLAAVLERAVSILNVFGGELAIYHDHIKELEIVASNNLGMNSGGVHLKHGEGAMGRVAETKEALIIPDYQEWEGRSNKYTKTTVHSVMVVPLMVRDQLLGALAVVHLDKQNHFSEEDLILLNLFAPLAATAIENARLFSAERKRADEQKALLETMQDLSGKLELKILLQSVVKRSVELLKVTGGELAIYHPEDKQLEVVASLHLGMDSLGLRLDLGEGAMGTAAANKETLIIQDYQTWASKSEKYAKTKVHSVMVVPLMIKDQLVGALCSVHLDKNRHFNQEDIDLLNLFAPLAATAIDNARLFNKTKILLEEAKQRTVELNNTQHQLIQQEKLASLGELTAGIAHEIQNPLNFVNNFSEISSELIDEMSAELVKGDIEEATKIANDIKQNLEKITYHGKRADAIVKGMLQHSRSGSTQKELTDLNQLCDEYLRLAYHGLRAKDKSFNATLKTEFDETIGLVNILAQDIGRVVLNLITNAFYAVAEKSKQDVEGYEAMVTVSTKKSANQLEIKVADNGNGIPHQILDKIFQPFFTTKPTGEGTGLGLSLSYDIVKAHGGELRVETKEGDGSEFIILLFD